MTAKAILVTGAGSGIGRAAARRFAEAGWLVGAYDVDPDAAAATGEHLAAGQGHSGVMDVTDDASVAAALDEFTNIAGGRLDVLFNSAGVLSIGAFSDLPLARHLRHVDVNLAGLMRVTHAAFPALRATPGARVINMSSASADYGVPDFATYSASKFGVRGLTEALNLEWRRHDIHVCDMMPPFVRTPMLAGGPEPRSLQRLGVRLEADDVAAAVWRAATGRRRKTHWPVSRHYRLLYYTGLLLPPWLKRLIMRTISGY